MPRGSPRVMAIRGLTRSGRLAGRVAPAPGSDPELDVSRFTQRFDQLLQCFLLLDLASEIGTDIGERPLAAGVDRSDLQDGPLLPDGPGDGQPDRTDDVTGLGILERAPILLGQPVLREIGQRAALLRIAVCLYQRVGVGARAQGLGDLLGGRACSLVILLRDLRLDQDVPCESLASAHALDADDVVPERGLDEAAGLTGIELEQRVLEAGQELAAADPAQLAASLPGGRVVGKLTGDPREALARVEA